MDVLFGVLFLCALLLVSEIALRTRIWYHKRKGKQLDQELEQLNGLANIHERNDDCEISCVIHNPSDHHMRSWPMVWRNEKYVFERQCKHGIGHPDPDCLAYMLRKSIYNGADIHGCDGCCDPPTRANGFGES